MRFRQCAPLLIAAVVAVAAPTMAWSQSMSDLAKAPPSNFNEAQELYNSLLNMLRDALLKGCLTQAEIDYIVQVASLGIDQLKAGYKLNAKGFPISPGDDPIHVSITHDPDANDKITDYDFSNTSHHGALEDMLNQLRQEPPCPPPGQKWIYDLDAGRWILVDIGWNDGVTFATPDSDLVINFDDIDWSGDPVPEMPPPPPPPPAGWPGTGTTLRDEVPADDFVVDIPGDSSTEDNDTVRIGGDFLTVGGSDENDTALLGGDVTPSTSRARIASLYGDGFYYLPGTDIVIKVPGNVRYGPPDPRPDITGLIGLDGNWGSVPEPPSSGTASFFDAIPLSAMAYGYQPYYGPLWPGPGFFYNPGADTAGRYGGYQRPADDGGRLVDTDPRGKIIDSPPQSSMTPGGANATPRTGKLIEQGPKGATATDKPVTAPGERAATTSATAKTEPVTGKQTVPAEPRGASTTDAPRSAAVNANEPVSKTGEPRGKAGPAPRNALVNPDQPVSKTGEPGETKHITTPKPTHLAVPRAAKTLDTPKQAKRTAQKKQETKSEFHIEFYSTRGGSYSSSGSFGGPGGGGFGLGH